MGHERIGMLPRSVKWRTVVDDLAKFSRKNVGVDSLARSVLKNVHTRYENIANDTGVNAAFAFLLTKAYSAREEVHIRKPGPTASTSEMQLAKEIAKSVEARIGSREYGELAKAAAIDTLTTLISRSDMGQEQFFGKVDWNETVWRKVSDGSGFCELSRIFFAKFTERYLNYFLEREAGSQAANWDDTERLKKELRDHVQRVSKYAFETAKITQSFSAGWYNKHTKEGMPTERQIRAFLWTAFGKLREELSREGEIQ